MRYCILILQKETKTGYHYYIEKEGKQNKTYNIPIEQIGKPIIKLY
jgi:hypothetical protein